MNTVANGEPLPMNGEAPKERPKRVRKKPKAETTETPQQTIALPQESVYAKRGRLASELIAEDTRWLVRPWFPLAMLTLVTGEASTGKSSLFAWLMAMGGKTLILPGEEEKPELQMLPRLLAAGCNRETIRILDDHPYVFPRDKKLVAGIAKEWGANRVLLDPLDNYLAEGVSENDGQEVRTYLESLGWIAHEAGCSVIGARHPGKEPGNILPGSRQWRTVPRQIVEVVLLPGVVKKRLLRLEKDGLGTGAVPTYFTLEDTPFKAKRFKLGDAVDATAAAMAKEVEGPGRRWAVMLACQLIRELFHDEEEPTVEELNTRAREKGVGQNSLDDAKRLLGVFCKPKEKNGKWYMLRTEKEWPAWLPACEY